MKKRTRVLLSVSALFLMASGLTGTLSACAELHKQAVQPQKPAVQSQPPTAIPREPIGTKAGELLLVYPRGENNNKIEASSTFLVGAASPGKALSVNGEAISTNRDGYFSHPVKLNYGLNRFNLKMEGQSQELNITVERPAPKPVLSPGTFNILPESLEPKEAIGLSTGDIVQFAARATPGCLMSVQIGSVKIPMKPAISKAGKNPSVNLGLDTAFGVSYQRNPAAMRDLYLAFYKVQAEDNWHDSPPVFTLQEGKRIIKARAKGTLTVIKQPGVLLTAHKNTIVRLGPGQARVTPLPEGVRMLANGFKGDWWRLELAPNKNVWIAREDMLPETEMDAPPQSRVSTVNLSTDAYGARIAVPLSQKLPYQLEQDINSKRLILKIFGATADTDFVTSDLKPGDSACAKLIDYLCWKQKGDLHYELVTQLLHKQCWGYYADYEDNTLVLHIKSAPALNPGKATLEGAVICVDPGHGGREIGSIGCSGAREARVNLEIAGMLQKALQDMGARVIMTRTEDIDVSLQERVDTAIAAKADLLVSVHNNALPDGRDPMKEHGTSSYWYHQQSVEIAGLCQKNLAQATGFKDFGSRYQNLALCRPTQMPAYLMEIGFMINPDELSKLLDPEFQKLVGESIAKSIRSFLLEKLSLEKQKTQGGLPEQTPAAKD